MIAPQGTSARRSPTGTDRHLSGTRHAATANLAVVHISGDVDQRNAHVVDTVLQDMLSAQPPGATVVADLSRVTFFGAAGLRVLLQAGARSTSRDIDLVIVAPTGGVLGRLLQITALEQEFTVATSIDHIADDHIPFASNTGVGLPRRPGPGNRPGADTT